MRRPPYWSVQTPRKTRISDPVRIGVPTRSPNWVSLRPSCFLIWMPMIANIVQTAKQTVNAIVDATQGYDHAAVAAARADVGRLKARDVEAQLRVTRSPSETLAAATTLVTRGATTLIVRHVDAGRLLAPLQRSHPGLRIVVRG